MKSFVLIQVEPGKENEEVVKQLKNYKEEIKNVYQLEGIYDVVAEIETSDEKELINLVMYLRENIDGVYRTYPLICKE